MKILAVGDSYFSTTELRKGLAPLSVQHQIEFLDVEVDDDFVPRDDSERRLLEFEGNPDQIAAALDDHDVLVVHGAPVSAGVLRASPNLRLVCCARGGPVNVDVRAAQELGISVSNTPGKNAPAVAELTLALSVMLARDVQGATDYLRSGGELSTAFDGAKFFGYELSGMQMGLVGFGRVGSEVCSRVVDLGMTVGVFDPFVPEERIRQAGATPSDLEHLVESSDLTSIHARLTAETHQMVSGNLLRRFKQGAFLINTAREGLLDEVATLKALRNRQLGGLAVDVFEPNGPLAEAARDGEPRLLVLPHIGGATFPTIDRASAQLVDHIQRYVRNQGRTGHLPESQPEIG